MLGVDAGSARTAAVLVELTEGGPQVVGVGLLPSAGLRKGVVVDLAAAATSIKEAVAQACQMAGRPGVTRAVMGISGPHLRSVVGSATRPVHRPAAGVSAEDLRAVLKDAADGVDQAEGREVIHVVPRQYQLDQSGPLADPLGLMGRSLTAEAHLITGDSAPVQNYLLAAREAGLDVVDYQVGIRAAGEAVLTRQEREAGVLFLDIGAGTTGVAVYDQGLLYHVTILPVGSEHITTDLAVLLQTPVSIAERLKIERGWATADLSASEPFELPSPSGQRVREVTERQVAEIIEPRVHEILQLSAQAVKRSGYTGLFPAGLVLTGGGSRLRGLLEVAADGLGLPARLAMPEGPLVAGPEFATALGLTTWGARLAVQEAVAAAKDGSRWPRVKEWVRGLFS